ncbi:MAG: shikimate dehydrogenase [Verrucomicrobia subdivision 3 bacterium]|nr:shikimate dehydrogenase [Limisphaerales bacterium]
MAASFTAPIDASTRYCAVFGHPIRHSASPALQNAGIAALGLNWRYIAFEVDPERLRDAIFGAKVMGFVGLNLTVPHKLLAMDMVDALDESARSWGAVNTIRFEGCDPFGTWKSVSEFSVAPHEVRTHGFNTDADAIIQALREDLGFEPERKRVLVLGAGGAGRVAALRLAAAGVSELSLVNRTLIRAEVVAEEIRERFGHVAVQTKYPSDKVDLLLNATSLGLQPDDPLPLDETRFQFRHADMAYDMIYRPAETLFLRGAKAAGCRVANGIGMLLFQGAKALELWTGKKAPISIMREALVREVYGAQ